MTESDPGSAPHEPTAGEVGVHRQDMTEPVTDVGDSRNVAPQRGRTATGTSPVRPEDSSDDEAERSRVTGEEEKPEMERAGAERSGGTREEEKPERSGDGTYEEEAGMKRTDKSGTTGQVDEVDEVRRDIAQTRDELGETVDAIAAKADVRTRARERVQDVRTMTKEKATEVAGRVREATPDTVKEAADKMAVRVRGATPEPVKEAADKVAEQSRRHPVMTATIAAVALLVLRRLLRRRRRQAPARK